MFKQVIPSFKPVISNDSFGKSVFIFSFSTRSGRLLSKMVLLFDTLLLVPDATPFL